MAIDITTISVEMDTSSLRAGQTQLDRTAAAGANLARSFAGVAAAFGAGLGITELARKLVDTERVTGSLNASLEVSTGSAENAREAFAALAQLGTELPESLNDVTKAFTMMVNRGLDPSQAAIKSYANTASAMNKSLMQMVEAVADAATGSFVRLEEFGIKARTQGDKIAFTFKGTTKTVQNNADAISNYLKALGENDFAGMAEKKMATLDGAISNLGDSWDGLFRTINETGLGAVMGDVVRSITSAIGDVTNAIKSGQVAGVIDAVGVKFKVVADIAVAGFTTIIDAAKGAYGLWYMMHDSFLGYFGSSMDDASNELIDAFKRAPENIKAFIQLIVVEVLSLSEKVAAVGVAMKESLNPLNALDGSAMKKLGAEMARINGVRDDSIASILKERDATTDAAKAALDKAAADRKAYENRVQELEDLGKYKVKAGEVTELTKEQTKAIEELAKKEADRAENIADLVASMTREADLMGEQSKEAQVRYDIEKKLLEVKGGISGAEAESLINAARMVDLKKKELDYTEELNKKILADVEEQTSASIQSVGDIFDKAEKDAQALSDALTDALMRGFESGKSFAKNLADSVKNMFKTMVLKPRVEAIVDKVKGYAEKAIGGLSGTAGTVLAAASVVSSLWNDYMEKDFKELTSEFRQSKQSTGTLLGNANAKSDSINKAINELGDNGKSLLDVNHGMYQALIDIRSGIAGSAAGFARQGLGAGAGLGIKTGIETSGALNSLLGGGVLGVAKNLFGGAVGGFIDSLIGGISKAIYNKKTSIIDSGIQILGGTLADAIESGTIGAMNYAEVKTTKKFLGLTTSSKVKTETSDLNEEFKRQFADVFGSAGDALQEASKAFGANFDASKLMIDATKLSLKGLEGDALTKEIESFFSSTLDKWAVSLVDSLGQFQEVGEGAFETMIRLAGETNTFVNYANQLGLKFKETGLNAVIVTQSLADMAGGFDQLNSGMASYYQNFFDETEKSKAGLAAIGKALGDVGIALPATREEFRALVEKLDLTKEAEQKQFAALMNVNQAFAQLVPATKAASDATTELVNTFDAIADQQRALSEKLFDMTATTAQKQQAALDAALSAENKAIQQQINDIENLNAAKSAQASIDAESYSLETQRLALLGDTNALRERELANINPANQAKQKEIWALEDAKSAAEAAAQAQEAMAQSARDSAEEQKRLMQGVHDSITNALKSLMGQSDTFKNMTQAQARMTLQGALMTAKSGGSLVGYAGLEDALSAIQQEGTYGSAAESRLAIGRNIGLLSELAKYTNVNGSHANGLDYVPFDGYVAQLHKGERVQTASEAKSNGDLAAKVDRLIEVVNSGNIAIAQNTAKSAKIAEKWDNDGSPETRSVA
jgi:hypothetical protein